MRGNGTRFIVISFKSTFSDPSKRIEHVRLVSRCAAIVFIASNGREPSPTPDVDAFLEEAAAAGVAAEACVSLLASAQLEPSPSADAKEAAAEAAVCDCCLLRAARTALSPRSNKDPTGPLGPPSPLGRRTNDSAVTGACDEDEEDDDDDDAVAFVVAFTMSISAWFSIGSTQSQNSVSSDSESTLLYGLVMTSSSSLGNTAVVKRYTSGKSSASKCSR